LDFFDLSLPSSSLELLLFSLSDESSDEELKKMTKPEVKILTKPDVERDSAQGNLC
jgi:hypothetical protein